LSNPQRRLPSASATAGTFGADTRRPPADRRCWIIGWGTKGADWTRENFADGARPVAKGIFEVVGSEWAVSRLYPFGACDWALTFVNTL
jgi:hypothetical protein